LAALSPAADLVFSPAGSPLLAHLRTRLPVVYSSDTTARLLLDYYPQFTGLSRRAIRNAEDLERAAIARADLLLYPTRWAADSAIADYGADPDRIRVIPYGANLRESPQDPGVRDVAPGAPCRLLLVGANWAIKGGEIAIDTLAALRARGIEAELTVVGSAPEARRQMPGLTFIPFLDKNRAEDRARLDALYRAADFFILPSRCECYGIVFCEAAAYGLPALASRTGGIPEVVREGETGYTLPLSADGAAYADRIMALRADPDGYRALRAASRRAFESLLNWDSWGRAAAEAVREMLGRLESRKA
jgi:glycosyltransferase involved in cell wall biosynthesis